MIPKIMFKLLWSLKEDVKSHRKRKFAACGSSAATQSPYRMTSCHYHIYVNIKGRFQNSPSLPSSCLKNHAENLVQRLQKSLALLHQSPNLSVVLELPLRVVVLTNVERVEKLEVSTCHLLEKIQVVPLRKLSVRWGKLRTRSAKRRARSLVNPQEGRIP
ncbi:hypothetical protein L208DRAFT_4038 [Tricholoma matsutake]|nr:hypothetical protein L208DRAFT_4038 [Tricholoma matsutake 945]